MVWRSIIIIFLLIGIANASPVTLYDNLSYSSFDKVGYSNASGSCMQSTWFTINTPAKSLRYMHILGERVGTGRTITFTTNQRTYTFNSTVFTTGSPSELNITTYENYATGSTPAIVINAPGNYSTTNYLKIFYKTGNPYANGSYQRNMANCALWNATTDDLAMQLYGDSDNSSTYLYWNPTSFTNATTYLHYFLHSSQTYFGTIYIKNYISQFNNITQTWGSETILDSTIIDGYSLVNNTDVNLYGYTFNDSYWRNTTFYLRSYLNDSIGVIQSSTVYSNGTTCVINCIPIPNATVLPTATVTPLPTPSLNNDTNNTVNNSWGANWTNYSRNQTAKYNGTIIGIFNLIKMPINYTRAGVRSINNSLNTVTYSGPMNFLTLVVPSMITAIHWKVRALFTLYLTLQIILIIFGRE